MARDKVSWCGRARCAGRKRCRRCAVVYMRRYRAEGRVPEPDDATLARRREQARERMRTLRATRRALVDTAISEAFGT